MLTFPYDQTIDPSRSIIYLSIPFGENQLNLVWLNQSFLISYSARHRARGR